MIKPCFWPRIECFSSGGQESQCLFCQSATTFQKDWCWSWGSNTLAPWCEELTLWKRPWCWERLKAGGEGDHRGWDGWMVSLTQWTWLWVDSGNWWWTGRPSRLQSMGLQRVGHDWMTELSWTELWPHWHFYCSSNTKTCSCLILGPLHWLLSRPGMPFT